MGNSGRPITLRVTAEEKAGFLRQARKFPVPAAERMLQKSLASGSALSELQGPGHPSRPVAQMLLQRLYRQCRGGAVNLQQMGDRLSETPPLPVSRFSVFSDMPATAGSLAEAETALRRLILSLSSPARDQRCVWLNIRLTEELIGRLKSEAEDRRQSFSALLREMLVPEAGKAPDLDPECWTRLSQCHDEVEEIMAALNLAASRLNLHAILYRDEGGRGADIPPELEPGALRLLFSRIRDSAAELRMLLDEIAIAYGGASYR